MKHITIGIVDYGLGNHASISYCLKQLGFRVKVSKDTEVLESVDLLILPGVGAFQQAMNRLQEYNLNSYLQRQSSVKPIIGICLGMQLLATSSDEYGYHLGLNLIPGEIKAFNGGKHHIGWNAMESIDSNCLFELSYDDAFYFNHSFYYEGPSEYQIGASTYLKKFSAVIRKDNIVGVQFHPEKSQLAGKMLLANIIKRLVNG